MPYQKAVILSPMINKNNVPCFFPSYSVYIDCPTGNVFPCDCTVHRKDENYCLGNIYEKSLQVIWKDKKIKDIIAASSQNICSGNRISLSLNIAFRYKL